MKVIVLLNMKGGVGKTLLSTNIASGLSKKNKVLVIDLDPQGNATMMFTKNMFPGHHVGNLLMSDFSVIEVKDIILNVDKNVDLLPSDLSLVENEVQLRIQSSFPQHERVRRIINTVKKDYDYVIIDCPPTLSLLTVNAIVASSLVIIPIKPDIYAIRGFMATTKNMLNLKKNYGLKVDYRIVFNDHNKNNDELDIINQVRESAADKCFKTIIRHQSKPVTKATTEGVPVIFGDSNVAEDLKTFVKEVEDYFKVGG